MIMDATLDIARDGSRITCRHSWHYGPDGLPTCREDDCHGLTIGCGQGSIVCRRHLDRLTPPAPAAPFAWFARSGS